MDIVLPSQVPVGSIFPFAGTSAPAGFLFCTGAPVSRSTYAALFAVIGENFGAGDGSSTFNLPDTFAKFLRGAGAATVDGINYNATFAAVQGDQMQGHRHEIATGNSAGANSSNNAGAASATIQQNTSIGFPTSDGTNGTPRTGTETRPVNLAVNFIIKY